MPQCPNCHAELNRYRNPLPTVDIIIECIDPDSAAPSILLIKRKNRPFGWALPGGFIDAGESAPAAALREAKEETDLAIEISSLLGVYSDPSRDPRFHTISMVYIATGEGVAKAGDDAAEIMFLNINSLPPKLAFDHLQIFEDYLATKRPSTSN
jgi:ADP-ribose pyrophosphatase YjhB (NUDIX family)